MGMRIGGWRGLVALAVLVSGCPSAPEPLVDGGALFEAGPPCASAADCDDGRFCNGAEVCTPGSADADARGCAPGTLPCLESQRCSETEGRCITACAIAPDADGDGADAIACGGTDCDDTDAMRFPGSPEVCDAASRDEDCDPSTFGARDADGDTFVDAACCNDDGGVMRCGTDCNDSRRDAHPGSTEACERIDNDCDGAIDEGVTVMAWPDRDFDLHGVEDDSMRQEVCPGTPGYAQVSDDCDDTSPTRHRAQLEICDGVDNDCDGLTDEAPVSVAWYPDGDGDLFGARDPSLPNEGVVVSCAPVEGFSTRSTDCDDRRANVRPGATELCNGVDDDCNGLADAGALRPGDTEDDDGDGYADVVCGGSDCDDAVADVHPDALELCNDRDDDCDTVVDGADAMAMWYLDLDRDGYGADDDTTPIVSCEPQGGRVPRAGDCDDDDASVRPRVADPCSTDLDGAPLDEDCDGSFDENGIRFAFFPDADADGFGASDLGGLVFACTRPAGTAAGAGDCVDTDSTRYPGAREDCQGLDDDCDAVVDEDSDRSWYLDLDLDGHGAGTAVLACMPPAGRVDVGDDCDDTDSGNFPGNAELCNGRDDDCDATADDGAAASCSGFAFATGACTGGACSFTCATGYADCDGEASTGCEADLRRSAAYCGSCTNACEAADSCGTTTPGTCDHSPVVAVAGNATHVFALRASGGLAAWGGSATGVTTYTDSYSAPVSIWLGGIAQITSGPSTACARTTARRVLCWGGGGRGQLGDGTTTGVRLNPAEASGITDAIDVAVGYAHACAVHADGGVSCWGAGEYGQLGLGTADDAWVPTRVPGITDALEVYAGSWHTCVRRGVAGGYYVTCWGYDAEGQLGLGSFGPPQHAPGARVIGLPADVVDLAHGTTDGTCARGADGRMFCWGHNATLGSFPLGVGAPGALPSATLVPGVAGVVEIALDSGGGCLRRRGAASGTHEVWCWGGYGGYTTDRWIDGDTTTTYAYNAVRAGAPGAAIDDAVSITVGTARWCAVRAGGGVVCMGHDGVGSLGDGEPVADVTSGHVNVLGFP